MIRGTLWCLFHKLNKHRIVSNNDLPLDFQTQCPLVISTTNKHFIFSPKSVPLTIFFQKHHQWPCQRWLTRAIFGTDAFQLCLHKASWIHPLSSPLPPPSSPWTPAITSHQSSCFCLSFPISLQEQPPGQSFLNKQFQRRVFCFFVFKAVAALLEVHGFPRGLLGKRPHTCTQLLLKLSHNQSRYFIATRCRASLAHPHSGSSY